jgi:regulator of replication initiation timing
MQQPVISDATKSEASPEICDEHNQLARKPQSDNVREMHSELHTLHAEVYNLQLNNQQLVAQLAKREQELVQEREQNQHLIEQINHAKNNYQPIPVVESKLSLPKLLSEQGIEPSLQAEAIRALIHPKNMDILSMLYADPMQIKPKLTKAFALSCDHPECIAALQQVANALVMVEHPYQCEYCAGSDNQRAIRLMVQICNKHRCYRLAIVGGSDQAHQEIRSLLKDNFKLSLINGELRRNKQQATEDLRNNDLIVIWCTAQLPHRTSELYTEQRDAFPNRIIRVHRNGISSLASEICQFLEQSHNMGQSNRS